MMLILNLIVNAWVGVGMGDQYGTATGCFCFIVLMALTNIADRQRQG